MSDIRFIAQLAIDDIGESLNKDDLPHGHAVVTIYCVLFFTTRQYIYRKRKATIFFLKLLSSPPKAYRMSAWLSLKESVDVGHVAIHFFFLLFIISPRFVWRWLRRECRHALQHSKHAHKELFSREETRWSAIFFSLFLGYWFYVSRKLMLGTKKIHAPNRSSPQNRTWSAWWTVSEGVDAGFPIVSYSSRAGECVSGLTTIHVRNVYKKYNCWSPHPIKRGRREGSASSRDPFQIWFRAWPIYEQLSRLLTLWWAAYGGAAIWWPGTALGLKDLHSNVV